MWIRHEVFVREDGKFGGVPFPDQRMVDRFDVIPEVEHLIAYDGEEPVATLRINRDLGGGLPAEHYFDFRPWREIFKDEQQQAGGGPVVLVSGGMLAVRKDWRSRRDVIRALYKIASSVLFAWGCTHVIAAVNHETTSIYRRARFEIIAEQLWVDEVGNYIVPLAARAKNIYDWAFGDLLGTSPVEIFKDTFRRTLLRSGEVLFREGDSGDCAYVIDSGNVRISRHRKDGSSFVLAVLGKGDLLGELALIDDLPRSATAEALGDVELINLDLEHFGGRPDQGASHLAPVLKLFSARLRKTDELATVLALESPDRRLEFAIRSLRDAARPDPTRGGMLVARVGVDELARLAVVETRDAQAFLETLHRKGILDVGKNRIGFLS